MGSPLGGGFRFYQLQQKVDAKALLEMEHDEMTDAVIASHYDVNRRGGPSLILMTTAGYDYLVARNASNEGFYLVWDGSQEPPVFDAEVYGAIVNEANKAGLKPTYHVYCALQLLPVLTMCASIRSQTRSCLTLALALTTRSTMRMSSTRDRTLRLPT